MQIPAAPPISGAMGYRVAVVGATGNVGREILQILAERNFPADEVVALASAKSAGREVKPLLSCRMHSEQHETSSS